MIKDYYEIIEALSKLHIIPYCKWDNVRKSILRSILGDIPFFITRNGNVFIGEDSPNNIKNSKICFQAHIDHPGGKLYFSHNRDYMYSKFYGQKNPRYLVDRKFGVFLPKISESIDQLRVEHCYGNGRGDVTLFFKANNDLMEKYDSGELIIHYDSDLRLENDTLSNWNLDDMLNVALIIYLLKHENYIDKCYGLLTINEEVGHLGLYEFLNITFDKELYFISMDVIYSGIETDNSFGIRMKQDGVKLDKFVSKEVMDCIDEKYRAVIPFGVCEGVTLIRANKRSISLFVKINNFHNGLPFKKFASEEISISLLRKYTDFVKMIADNIENSLRINPIQINVKKTCDKLSVNITNHADHIKDIILGCDNYTDYLTRGLPELRKIFSQYNLNIPNMSSNLYYRYKQFLTNKENIILNKDDIDEIVEYLIKKVEKIFNLKKEIFLQNINNVEIVQILLGNFNACNYFTSKRIIMLSNDKITNNQALRLIAHELTHYLTANIWRSINIPNEVRTYYDEGLAVYLSSKIFNLEIYESLGLSKKTYDRYLSQKKKLEKWFSDYIKGNYYKLYKGKIHEYFIKNDIPHPFYASQNDVSRYGYFLSSLETRKMIEEGSYYEKLLCK